MVVSFKYWMFLFRKLKFCTFKQTSFLWIQRARHFIESRDGKGADNNKRCFGSTIDSIHWTWQQHQKDWYLCENFKQQTIGALSVSEQTLTCKNDTERQRTGFCLFYLVVELLLGSNTTDDRVCVTPNNSIHIFYGFRLMSSHFNIYLTY